jgi:hypothetical protein
MSKMWGKNILGRNIVKAGNTSNYCPGNVN